MRTRVAVLTISDPHRFPGSQTVVKHLITFTPAFVFKINQRPIIHRIQGRPPHWLTAKGNLSRLPLGFIQHMQLAHLAFGRALRN